MHDWGVVEETVDIEGAEFFKAFHILPMVDQDGTPVMSGAHELSDLCPCRPLYSFGEKFHTDIWTHHDPEHPGACTPEEWAAKVEEVAGESFREGDLEGVTEYLIERARTYGDARARIRSTIRRNLAKRGAYVVPERVATMAAERWAWLDDMKTEGRPA